jgi:hypothetical protein
MKKYHSSPAGFLILVFGALLIETWANYNGIVGLARAVIFIALVLVILFFLQRQTYLIIDAGQMKYSHYSFKRAPVTISKITEIRRGPAFGLLGVALYIVYKTGNDEAQLKVYSRNFSRQTLMRFLKELKEINGSIKIDEYFAI